MGEEMVEEKENVVQRDGVNYWDKYQNNLDEQCDVSQLEVIDYRKLMLVLALAFAAVTIGMIITWSEVYYHELDDGTVTREIIASTPGTLGFGLLCGVSGWMLGKYSKRVFIAVPASIAISFLGIYAGILLGPYIIEGTHPVWWLKLFVCMFIAPVIMSVSSFAAVGTFLQD